MIEPEKFLDKTILVDSNYDSRQNVIKKIRSSSIAKMVVEVSSVIDGLRNIETGGIEVCFLGPSLSKSASRHLIRVARNLPASRNCAFVALNQKGISDYTTLKNEITIDATIDFPFLDNDFRAVIEKTTTKIKYSTSPAYQLSQHPSDKFDQIHRPTTSDITNIHS